MKVAFLLGSLNRGGTETLMFDSVKRASDAQFESIGIFRKKGDLYDDFTSTQVPLFQLSPKSIFDFNYFFDLRKLLLANNVKVIHAHQPLDAFYAYFACLFTGIKIVLTLHGYGKKDKYFARVIRRFITKRTDLNLYVSDAQRKYYQRKYRLKSSAKQKVLHNGINFDKLKNTNSTSVRKEFAIPQNHLLLGSIGNFVGVRDQMTICKFLHLLDKKGISFSFLFAGAKDVSEPWRFDDCVNYCKEQGLSKKVFFLGTRSDIPSILKELDAFIYSSSHDSFGIAVIEALATGLPVFVNDWEVMLEITGHGEHGIFYKTKDEQDLYDKFIPFTINKADYINKAKTDAKWVQEQYNITHYLEGLNKNYTDLF